MDLNKAILYGQAVNQAYAIAPDDLANRAGTTMSLCGADYKVISSIYANDLATDMNPEAGKDRVSIGFIFQGAAGDVIVAIRGTEGWREWMHDAQFLLVPCPFMPSAGSVEDGFKDMYCSMRIGSNDDAPTVTQAMTPAKDGLPKIFTNPITSVMVCGHSLGGALATLLVLDIAVNTPFFPSSYTYASPRTGDPQFVRTYNHCVPDTTRIANRLDVVPNLPFPPLYEHVLGEYPLNPAKVTLFPPSVTPLVKPELGCLHFLSTYLHLLSQLTGGPVINMEAECQPPKL
jgi:Lipase (class 3)